MEEEASSSDSTDSFELFEQHKQDNKQEKRKRQMMEKQQQKEAAKIQMQLPKELPAAPLPAFKLQAIQRKNAQAGKRSGEITGYPKNVAQIDRDIEHLEKEIRSSSNKFSQVPLLTAGGSKSAAAAAKKTGTLLPLAPGLSGAAGETRRDVGDASSTQTAGQQQTQIVGGANKPNVLVDTHSLQHKLMPDLALAQARREVLVNSTLLPPASTKYAPPVTRQAASAPVPLASVWMPVPTLASVVIPCAVKKKRQRTNRGIPSKRPFGRPRAGLAALQRGGDGLAAGRERDDGLEAGRERDDAGGVEQGQSGDPRDAHLVDLDNQLAELVAPHRRLFSEEAERLEEERKEKEPTAPSRVHSEVDGQKTPKKSRPSVEFNEPPKRKRKEADNKGEKSRPAVVVKEKEPTTSNRAPPMPTTPSRAPDAPSMPTTPKRQPIYKSSIPQTPHPQVTNQRVIVAPQKRNKLKPLDMNKTMDTDYDDDSFWDDD